jgi:diamine N-acetyltransferase
MLLEGEHIKLRALEPEDLDFLFKIENDTTFWEVSHTQAPFSKFILKQYLENAHLDIYEAKQLRLMVINTKTSESIGMIDLFHFNPQHKRAGVGIMIASKHQGNNFASEALQLLIDYSFQHLNLHQLHASITPDNEKSIQLFTRHRFEKVGEKKDWIYTDGHFKNELIFQLINE